MAAAGGAAGKPVLQGQARREQCARSRSPGTAHHALADRQADAALDLPRHRTGKHLIDVSPIMSQRDDVGGGFIRGNEAVRGKSLFRDALPPAVHISASGSGGRRATRPDRRDGKRSAPASCAQPSRMRPSRLAGADGLLGKQDGGFQRTRPADESARMAEYAILDPGRLGKFLVLQAAPGFGQGQPLAEGARLGWNRPAVPVPSRSSFG